MARTWPSRKTASKGARLNYIQAKRSPDMPILPMIQNAAGRPVG